MAWISSGALLSHTLLKKSCERLTVLILNKFWILRKAFPAPIVLTLSAIWYWVYSWPIIKKIKHYNMVIAMAKYPKDDMPSFKNEKNMSISIFKDIFDFAKSVNFI